MLISLNELRYIRHAKAAGEIDLSLDTTYITNTYNKSNIINKKDLAKEYAKSLMKMTSEYYLKGN
ncbi:hypothetical protein [Priestia flexa]|uniref:hypothetical protein n=1 Tax=Priestia flexa TaxID=86664 RepID=UPI0004732FE3|nr:hypothetical protein [Priestia flexa]